MLTGGGTGGHITPILALAHELKRLKPDIHIVYIGEHGGKFAHMVVDNPNIDEIRTVWAGKFRRYHGESWLQRLLDVQTNVLNFRDVFYFLVGTLQALVLLRRLRPDAVLLKGGFVGVPAGLAAAFWRIPFVTHDSDSLPGLANRLVARWATYHATAMSAENYPYPAASVKYVGVLVSDNHKPVTAQIQSEFKTHIDVPSDCRLLVVTGGSGGSGSINTAIKKLLPGLLDDYQDLYVVHQVGKGKQGIYKGFSHARLRVMELLIPMYKYTGASDVVVTRAGATTVAELGVQGRATIIVPNPLLTGGHQLVNAKILEEQGGVIVVNETTLDIPQDLDAAIRRLLDSSQERKRLGKHLQDNTIRDAAHELAVVVLAVAGKS